MLGGPAWGEAEESSIVRVLSPLNPICYRWFPFNKPKWSRVQEIPPRVACWDTDQGKWYRQGPEGHQNSPRTNVCGGVYSFLRIWKAFAPAAIPRIRGTAYKLSFSTALLSSGWDKEGTVDGCPRRMSPSYVCKALQYLTLRPTQIWLSEDKAWRRWRHTGRGGNNGAPKISVVGLSWGAQLQAKMLCVIFQPWLQAIMRLWLAVS